MAEADFFRRSECVKSIIYVYEPTVKPKILKNSGECFFTKVDAHFRTSGSNVKLVQKHQFSRKIGNEEEIQKLYDLIES